MVTRYVDSVNGLDANDGLAAVTGGGHGPKQTLTGVEDTPVVAGDVIYVRPGVYREQWTWDVSGANNYVAGTVSVTNGSTTVQGAGTLWLANVAANYMFHNTVFASGVDGVTNGTATFTSAAGNFQANMVGYVIQINTKGAYKIDAVGGLGTITLSDPNGLGWPAVGAGLTYSVMSGMGPFDVLSVTDNTHLELTAPWYGPTLTGLAYITYNPIRAIGDVTGQIWGVGGTVRITGANAGDTAAVRASCIVGSRSYRVLRGFALDLSTSHAFSAVSPTYVTIEDCTFQTCGGSYFNISGAGQAAVTIRRCIMEANASTTGVVLTHTVAVNSTGHLISSCEIQGIVRSGSGYGVSISRIGGVAVRNCLIKSCDGWCIRVPASLTVGQTTDVQGVLAISSNSGLYATVVGEITSNFNSLYGNVTNYTNTAAGAGDLTYSPLFAMPLLFAGPAGVSGFRLPPPMPGELSQWSPLRALAGFGEPPADLMALKRPAISAKNSWGAVQYQGLIIDTTTPRSGTQDASLPDAGRIQIIIPVEAVNTTITCYVYRGANYAGVNPQMILKQPGQADITVTDAGGAGVYNQLTHTWIPAATPNWIVIELVSNNTALAGAYGCFFDDLTVSPLDTDTMEAWTADVQHVNYAEELATVSAAFSPVGSDIVKG